MKLRKLEEKDAPYMLEWMQDINITKCFQIDFSKKTVDDCYEFMNKELNNELHLAIVDDEDEYMGTVSLKHISNKNAEFAIVTRSVAHGKGYALYGMREIINIGFNKYNLDYIYWNVYKNNYRAIKFYDKNGFSRIASTKIDDVEKYYKDTSPYLWYEANCDNKK